MKNQEKINFLRQDGFYLFETIMCLTILISLMGIGSRYITKDIERSSHQGTASQLHHISHAAKLYVQDHYKEFSDQGGQLTVPKLMESHYLPTHTLSQNLHGQNYKIKVIADKKQLQILVLTMGGRAISEHAMRHIASQVGTHGGYSSTLHPGKIIGNQQGWELEEPEIEQGHLASWLAVGEREVMDGATFLRRVSFDGHPEYNRMETNLEIVKNNKLYFGPEGVDDTTELSAQAFLMGNKGNDWTTEIKPAEIRLESHSSGNKSYLGNDKIFYASNGNDWTTEIKPSEIRLKDQSSGNKAYLGNDKIIYEDGTTKTVQVSSKGIAVMSGEKDILLSGDHFYSWSGKTAIHAHWLSLPVYWYKAGQFDDGSDAAKQLCQSNADPFSPYPDGRMFLVRENLTSNYNIYVCIANYLAARIETSKVLLK